MFSVMALAFVSGSFSAKSRNSFGKNTTFDTLNSTKISQFGDLMIYLAYQ
jgi:hypothetical protein